MGGQGSGRRPDPVRALTRQSEPTSADDIYIPNLSGVKDAAKKTSPVDITGGGGASLWTSAGGVISPNSNEEISGASIFCSGNFSGANAFFSLKDDTPSAFNIRQGNNNYICVTTTNGDEAVNIGCLTSVPVTKFTSNHVYVNEPLTISGALIVSGALTTTGDITSDGDVYGTNITHLSGAYYTHKADTDIHFTSGALWTEINQNETDITTVSGAYYPHKDDDSIHFTSGALWTQINANDSDIDTVSGAYYSHASDSSDPHGSVLTQTHINSSGDISGAFMYVTGDNTTSGAAYVPDVVFGLGDTPPTASNFPQGTLYLKYTA